MRRTLCASVFLIFCATIALSAERPAAGLPMAGLHAAADITLDTNGVYHIRANNEADLFLMQGGAHARDRLFQMHQNRQLASGNLAEPLGPGALASDVQLQTIGLHRAAERSLAALSPETRASCAWRRGWMDAWRNH